MTSNPIVVPDLVIRVVTGDTCYRYENGFSAIYAEITTDDSQLAKQLRHAQEEGVVVTLRCAMLDVTGTLTMPLDDVCPERFVLSVQDLTYRKPREL